MQWDLLLTKYGFFLFTMGTALILANRLGFLHDRLGGLNRTLEERIRVLTETGVRLSASERRYRSLFEGSSEPWPSSPRPSTSSRAIARRPSSSGSTARRLAGALQPAQRRLRDEARGNLPAGFLRAAARSLKDKAGTQAKSS